MNKFDKWLDTEDSVSRRVFLLFGAGMFIVGLIFAMAFLVPEPTEGDILPYIIGFWWGVVMDRIVSKRIVDGVLYFNTSKKEGD